MPVHSSNTPRLKTTCIDGERCTLYIEPWGTEFDIQRGDALFVESEAFVTGDVEVSAVPGGISIAFTADVPILITTLDGRTLSV